MIDIQPVLRVFSPRFSMVLNNPDDNSKAKLGSFGMLCMPFLTQNCILS